MKIKCTTTFNITNTGVTGHFKPSRVPFNDHAGNLVRDLTDWDKSRNQQRNWETLTQLISLRTQVNIIETPQLINDHWQFIFEVDLEDLFILDQDPLGVLKQDCNGVPMLSTGTDNTVLAVDNNIWFDLLE